MPLEDSLGALAELQDEGKIRHIGVSNVARRGARARARASSTSSPSRTATTSPTAHSEDVLEVCEREGIGFIPWFPLATGDLARAGRPARRARRAPTTPRRARWRSPGCWRARPSMLPIPGTASVEHLEENVAAGELELEPQELERLAAAA